MSIVSFKTIHTWMNYHLLNLLKSSIAESKWNAIEVGRYRIYTFYLQDYNLNKWNFSKLRYLKSLCELITNSASTVSSFKHYVDERKENILYHPLWMVGELKGDRNREWAYRLVVKYMRRYWLITGHEKWDENFHLTKTRLLLCQSLYT